MSSNSKIRALTHAVVGLFTANKPNVTFQNRKDQYHKHYWFPENLCIGIEFVAEAERISKKGLGDADARRALKLHRREGHGIHPGRTRCP